MGCDIHMQVERRVDGTWEPELNVKPYRRRNYDVFAMLANVRNCRGFAGIPTGTPFVPLDDPRGFPADVSRPVARAYMGDHSYSWLWLDEVDFYFRVRGGDIHTRYGVVAWSDWRAMRAAGKTAPDTYWGDISGPGIKIIEEREAMPLLDDPSATLPAPSDRLHVRMSWQLTYAQCCDDEWRFFIDDLHRLDGLASPADIRLVFGFDS